MKTTEKNVEQAIEITGKLLTDDNLPVIYKSEIEKIKTLLTTETELITIAIAPYIGSKRIPKKG